MHNTTILEDRRIMVTVQGPNDFGSAVFNSPAEAKAFAASIGIVEQAVDADDGTLETARFRKMRDAALHEIITAQMWAVKVATLKL